MKKKHFKCILSPFQDHFKPLIAKLCNNYHLTVAFKSVVSAGQKLFWLKAPKCDVVTQKSFRFLPWNFRAAGFRAIKMSLKIFFLNI